VWSRGQAAGQRAGDQQHSYRRSSTLPNFPDWTHPAVCKHSVGFPDALRSKLRLKYILFQTHSGILLYFSINRYLGYLNNRRYD